MEKQNIEKANDELPIYPASSIVQDGPGFFEKIKQLFNYMTCGKLYAPPAQVVTLCAEASPYIPSWIHKAELLTEEELNDMAKIMKKF
ncbi:unnamed protein product [Caenorhabditis angaria]|uniref:Uncharacterized protein n=1 Tax=Caenorhabditis angaria TaxID=860376 RepID=A0A9P1N9N2_9PELO|nr:unnamed protein product [Caenorhabditis angaria]